MSGVTLTAMVNEQVVVLTGLMELGPSSLRKPSSVHSVNYSQGSGS